MAEDDPKINRKAKAQSGFVPAFAVRLNAFLRVKEFISTEETRYYLNGIRVEPCKQGGVLCVATDGHRLGVRRDPDGICDIPVIATLPRELRSPLKSLLATNPWLVCFANQDGTAGHLSVVEAEKKFEDDTAEAAIENADNCLMRFGRALIDGTYPDWSRIVPAKTKQEVAFNSKYLASFGSVLSINGENAAAPHIIQDEDDRDFLGVLMPMRVGGRPVPDWLKAA